MRYGFPGIYLFRTWCSTDFLTTSHHGPSNFTFMTHWPDYVESIYDQYLDFLHWQMSH